MLLIEKVFLTGTSGTVMAMYYLWPVAKTLDTLEAVKGFSHPRKVDDRVAITFDNKIKT